MKEINKKTSTIKCNIDDKMQHPDFRQIKIFGENFWPSKDSGGISLRYTVYSS